MSRTQINIISRTPARVLVRVLSGEDTLEKNGDLVFTPLEWARFEVALTGGAYLHNLNVFVNDDTAAELNDIT